jgi:glycosyltransferase involved in cell wall biosynthesis
MAPRITVVTPCYNQAEYLREAIQSVLAQTFEDFEYLLLDDGSTDNTWAVMQEASKRDVRLRCIRLEKQSNVGVVLNRSIREARGEYWVWCPSDDRLHARLLERKLEAAKKYSEAVLYSDWEHIDLEGQVLNVVEPPRLTAAEFALEVWKTSPIGFTGIWIPTEVFDRVGSFPTHLQASEDFEWMIRATLHVPFIGIPEVLYQKRLHTNRISVRNKTRIMEQVPKIRESLRAYQRLLRR